MSENRPSLNNQSKSEECLKVQEAYTVRVVMGPVTKGVTKTKRWQAGNTKWSHGGVVGASGRARGRWRDRGRTPQSWCSPRKGARQRAWLDPCREMVMFGVAGGWEAAELGGLCGGLGRASRGGRRRPPEPAERRGCSLCRFVRRQPR